jgi:hypothetical protein
VPTPACTVALLGITVNIIGDKLEELEELDAELEVEPELELELELELLLLELELELELLALLKLLVLLLLPLLALLLLFVPSTDPFPQAVNINAIINHSNVPTKARTIRRPPNIKQIELRSTIMIVFLAHHAIWFE